MLGGPDPTRADAAACSRRQWSGGFAEGPPRVRRGSDPRVRPEVSQGPRVGTRDLLAAAARVQRTRPAPISPRLWNAGRGAGSSRNPVDFEEPRRRADRLASDHHVRVEGIGLFPLPTKSPGGVCVPPGLATESSSPISVPVIGGSTVTAIAVAFPVPSASNRSRSAVEVVAAANSENPTATRSSRIGDLVSVDLGCGGDPNRGWHLIGAGRLEIASTSTGTLSVSPIGSGRRVLRRGADAFGQITLRGAARSESRSGSPIHPVDKR